MLSQPLEATLHRALSLASEHGHEYGTLEHLLYALIDDADAASVLRACAIDVRKLRQGLSEFLNGQQKDFTRTGDPKPTAEYQRSVQRAAIHVQNRGHDTVTGADVLVAFFSERNSHAVYLLYAQHMTRIDAVNFIQHGITKKELLPKHNNNYFEPPPAIPTQGFGPHVEINSEGTIAFSPPEALDAEGNHLARLQALHPILRGLASSLVAALRKGNIPHVALCDRAIAYTTIIDHELQVVDFHQLYVVGVRLANAAYAADRDENLPSLAVEAREELDSLLKIHGSFILATAVGAEALSDEQRYARRPNEERRLRADTISIVAALRSRPEILSPHVADQALGSVQEIGVGRNPERSSVIGLSIFRNIMISLAGGAAASFVINQSGVFLIGAGAVGSWFTLLTANEAVKKTKWFQRITSSTAAKADEVLDSQSRKAMETFEAGLFRQREFLINHREALSRVSQDNPQLKFLDEALDWLQRQINKQS